MQFGIFDHLDRNTLPLAAYYEQRLKLIEAYDRAGFYSYHLAEHHFTPLGMAPSPSVFLASIAQRTKRLRFGPLVYANNHTWTLAVGLAEFSQVIHRSVLWNIQMAASVLFMIPVIILFFLAQRVFIEGVTLTGVKG